MPLLLVAMPLLLVVCSALVVLDADKRITHSLASISRMLVGKLSKLIGFYLTTNSPYLTYLAGRVFRRQSEVKS